MFHTHDEEHAPPPTSRGPGRSPIPITHTRRALAVPLLITGGFFVVEVLGAYLTNSLTLLADASHMLVDVVALAMALMANWIAGRPHTSRRSYGAQRAEILAVLANGLVLWGLAAYIFIEAFRRLDAPPPVQSGAMLGIAVAGLIANLASAWILLGSARHSLNVRSALFHVLGDALTSVGAITAALLIVFFGWLRADAVAGLVIAAVLVITSFKLVWPAIHILLEGTPNDLDLLELEHTIREVEGVQEVHDLHAWTLTSGYNAVTAHVVLLDPVPDGGREEVLDLLRHLIPERFPVRHITIQVEESSYCCDEAHLPGARAVGVLGRKLHLDEP